MSLFQKKLNYFKTDMEKRQQEYLVLSQGNFPHQ